MSVSKIVPESVCGAMRLSSFGSGVICRIVLFGVLVLFSLLHVRAVPIAGANGRVVDFVGVKSGGPSGLNVQMQADGDAVDIAWDKLDLARLKTEYPAIFAAFEASKTGAVTELNLGTFAPAKANSSVPSVAGSPVANSGMPGRFNTGAGGGKFTIQMPIGEAPRAVLLLAIGQDGRSVRYMGDPERGRWSSIAKKLKLAVMAYDFPSPDSGSGPDGFKVAPFVAADKGSGEAVIKALESFAKLSGKAELASAPIAVFGQDVLGAAFAFNFSQLYPDRVIAAVAAKGAFYSVKPTDASAKTPLLILWGQYDEDIKLWKPSDLHADVYEGALELKPNWIYAMEPRGGSGETPQSHHFSLMFLDRMILARLDAEGKLKELDRSRSFVGDFDTLKISRMDDPDTVLEPNKTWLPDGEIAKLWEDFSNGVLEIPLADGNQ